jgi:hypothetical protein
MSMTVAGYQIPSQFLVYQFSSSQDCIQTLHGCEVLSL